MGGAIPHGESIVLGLLMGMLARVSMLRSDYRQYPSYPHGYTSHLFLGLIAALSGAVAVVALIEREWTAVTFLLLVSQQFREIRSMERDSLKAMEDSELVSRGSQYIENIARVFEARYYIVIFVAAASALGSEISSVWTGVILGSVAFAFGVASMRVEQLGNAVEIEVVPVTAQGPDIYVGDIFIMNVGLDASRQYAVEHGMGAILTPRDETARDTLANLGQRQAILHDVSAVLGLRKDADTPEFTPLARRDLATGRVGIYIVPATKDEKTLVETIKRVPVIESARGRSRFVRRGRIP